MYIIYVRIKLSVGRENNLCIYIRANLYIVTYIYIHRSPLVSLPLNILHICVRDRETLARMVEHSLAKGRAFISRMGNLIFLFVSKRTFAFKAGLILVCRLVSSSLFSGDDSAQKEENKSLMKFL